MSVDLRKEPDYDLLCEKLIEKTNASKIRWQETADENVYIAVVKGIQTFEVRRSFRWSNSALPQGQLLDPLGLDSPNFGGKKIITFCLTVKDSSGKEFISHSTTDPQSAVAELFRVAQRVASRIDERIEKSLELLNQL